MRYFEVVARMPGQNEDRTRFHDWDLASVKRIALRTHGKSADISIYDHNNNAPYGFHLVAFKYAGRERFHNV